MKKIFFAKHYSSFPEKDLKQSLNKVNTVDNKDQHYLILREKITFYFTFLRTFICKYSTYLVWHAGFKHQAHFLGLEWIWFKFMVSFCQRGRWFYRVWLADQRLFLFVKVFAKYWRLLTGSLLLLVKLDRSNLGLRVPHLSFDRFLSFFFYLFLCWFWV